MQKRCLVISYGPVPTPEHQTVEGGGMRAWGIAKGLLANGVETTVAVNSGFSQTLDEHEGVKLVSWDLDANFIRTINAYDSVVVSYCMGDLSVFVADNIRDDVQLILDCYVPIYIEVSARDAKNMDVEYVNYMADMHRHNRTLKRGDYFLYANPAQKMLYSGVLSALGITNPYSYRTERLIYAPFGVHRDTISTSNNPYTDIGIYEKDFTVLWFGGIYPWFRIEEYLDAIKKLSSEKNVKFVFVGGKNPFNANPDIARQYEKALEFASDNKLLKKTMFFVDWVDFDTRVNWFKYADVIVSLNQPGEENIYSWRTRVMDFVWGEAATITNGGDPLSEEMIEANAAIKLDALSSDAIVGALSELRDNPKKLKLVQKNVALLKEKYFWDIAMKPTQFIIEAGARPYADELPLQQLLDLGNAGGDNFEESPYVQKLRKVMRLPAKVVRKVQQKGVRKTAKVAIDIVSAQTRRRFGAKRESQFVFISHPIDHTGGPVVLLQIIEEYVQKYGANRVRVIAPGITPEQDNQLRSLGIRTEKAMFGADIRLVRLQLALQPDDFVLMNTIAVYDAYRDFILLWLKLGRLKHAYWFIHEDKAQIPLINPNFLHGHVIGDTSRLASAGKLSLLYPSKRTRDEYRDLLGINEGNVIKLRVEIPQEYAASRTAKDFDTINILLSGTSTDGRKGQVLALSALQDFVDNHYKPNPKKYRKVHLHLVAIRDNDYISQQVRWIAESALGKEFVSVYEPMPKDEAMTITRKCNTVLCCSLNETFGLYIAEGMLMGHIVLRNNSAGVDEQLVDGKNGYMIDHTNIKTVSRAIQHLADKSATTGQLLNMSETSRTIMKNYTKYTYLNQIQEKE